MPGYFLFKQTTVPFYNIQSVVDQCSVFPPIQSHYSLKKSAAVLGLGTDNMVVVKCDER